MQKNLTEHVPVVNWRNRHIIISIVGLRRHRIPDRHGNAVLASGFAGCWTSLRIAGVPDRWRSDHAKRTACGNRSAGSEVGLYKAVVLINRLNLFWGLDWEAVPHFVRCGQDVPDSDFLISCVDTRAARAAIARVVSLKSRRFHYWLDTGNLADRGQFVLGQPLRKIVRIARNGCRACTNSSPRSQSASG